LKGTFMIANYDHKMFLAEATGLGMTSKEI
jgi:hypothetical protein